MHWSQKFCVFHFMSIKENDLKYFWHLHKLNAKKQLSYKDGMNHFFFTEVKAYLKQFLSYHFLFS